MSSRRRSKFSSNQTDSHFANMMEWLALESKAEIERLAKRRQHRSLADAEKTGETLIDLVIVDEAPTLGQRTLVTFHKRNQTQQLPWNRLRVGSPVVVSEQLERDQDSLSGVVSQLNRDTIQVAMADVPEGNRFRVDLSADEVTRQRQLRAIMTAKDSRGRLGRLRTILMGEAEPSFSAIQPCEFQTHLNPVQQAAVQFALSAHDVAIIHGPPGTGKTTTVVELIIQAIRRGDKVLAVAPSNTAVDNLLERLVAVKQRVVRLGHPARIAESLRSHSLDGLVEAHENTPVIRQMIRDAEAIYRKSDKWTRAKRTRGEKQEMRADAKMLLKEARQLEQYAIESILNRANVICATTSFHEELIGDRWFDLIVIDEACQSTEPGCWIPLIHGDKVVLAGDHFQLPPTVLSEEAARRGFSKSMMERLMEVYGDDISKLLTIQYRMHESIMQFSSERFYQGQLEAHPSVARHLLSELPGVETNPLTQTPVQFIDTAGAGFEDELEPDGYSKLNQGEAHLVARIVNELLASGLIARDIAVIAPYSAQVRLLRSTIQQTSADSKEGSVRNSKEGLTGSSAIAGAFPVDEPGITPNMLPAPGIEIDTVDGFQGREKEAIVISLVVSNNRQEIGFLSDTRRINVALTRARRKLIVIGDSSTLGGNEFYDSFLQSMERLNAYQTIWDWKTW
jgi:ATP-dependent RNA/DNA helicase IGHMBP2